MKVREHHEHRTVSVHASGYLFKAHLETLETSQFCDPHRKLTINIFLFTNGLSNKIEFFQFVAVLANKRNNNNHFKN